MGQLTLRINNAELSTKFYELLGMRLLSRQRVEPYNFTLYFFAFLEETDELPPYLLEDGSIDIDAVGNREWLWQRKYTTLELQHKDSSTKYVLPKEGSSGWQHFTITASDTAELMSVLSDAGISIVHPNCDAKNEDGIGFTCIDPDGYRVHVRSQSRMDRNASY